jgi:hypothetical protein
MGDLQSNAAGAAKPDENLRQLFMAIQTAKSDDWSRDQDMLHDMLHGARKGQSFEQWQTETRALRLKELKEAIVQFLFRSNELRKLTYDHHRNYPEQTCLGCLAPPTANSHPIGLDDLYLCQSCFEAALCEVEDMQIVF